MQSFSFVPQNAGPREGQKNYVFVDEHNRHKRLKVTRACNGCRKRKIKCDAATTNTWPCSACTRLKLVCIPPSIGQGGDYSPHGQIPEASHQQPPGNLNVAVPPDASQQRHIHTDASPTTVGGITGYDHDAGVYQPQPYFAHTQDPRHLYHNVPPPHPELLEHSFHPGAAFYSTPPTQDSGLGVSPISTKPDASTADNLSDALGELRIDETGVAPYIRQQRRGQTDPEVPAIEENEVKLPPLSSTSGAFIRIPPELMPDEEDAMNYFSIYFNDIHPYMPVVHRSQLYQQWRNDRSSISPLLLEAIFACAGRMSDDPAQGAQWLALANRHEPSFMDSPRLSTIQALLLLLKAREAVPKKGYYYRSWQTLKTIISMAKDLDLHEHHGYHESGTSCGLDPIECLIQTRVWQTLLVLEIMIGGPQGRSDFGVDPETVEIRPDFGSNLEPFEAERSRQFAYFVRNGRGIRLTTDTYHKIKRQKDWGSDPRLLANNPFLGDWLASLPPDLQISYPADGSPPLISSHFVGNMHSHFHLATIILHRPQLLASKSFATGGEWRNHLALCYNSAKCLCRLQEAVLRSFGLSGLLFMLRGINFTIYCILTCTMIHLVAITSPDPEFHTDARMYFTRHMRLLEQCASSWPLPEIQAQIDALRLAFSADVNKPFELKPTFPYGSPSDTYHPTPPSLDSHYQPPPYAGQVSGTEPLAFPGMPVTPPISGETSENKHATSLHSAMGFMQSHGPNASLLNVPLVDGNSWDPTRIINQWDMAFPGGASNSSTNSPSSNPGSEIHNMLPGPGQQQYPAQYSQNPSMMSTTMAPQQPVSQSSYNMHPVISARDWQHSVASVFDPHGLKRRWGQSGGVLEQEQVLK